MRVALFVSAVPLLDLLHCDLKAVSGLDTEVLGRLLEGIVAKRRDSRYHSGRSRDWIKVKNMAHPAIERAMLIALSKRQTKRMRA